MAAKGNRRAMEIAYTRINGISREDMRKDEHQDRMITALTDIQSYIGLFPNETEALRDKRLEMRSPGLGEAIELATYLKEINAYGVNDMGLRGWEVIFAVQNHMKGEESEAVAKEAIQATEKPLNKEKENERMEHQSNALAQLSERFRMTSEGGGASVLAGAKPESMNAKETKDTALANWTATEARRLALTENGRITRMILACPKAKDRCVDGADAIGFIKNPDSVMETFVTHTGCTVNTETGEVSFTNIPLAKSNVEAALNMYNMIKAAQSNSEYGIKPNMTDSLPALKAFLWKESADTEPQVAELNTMKDILFSRAYFVLDFEDREHQVRLKSVKSKNKKSAKGEGTDKKEQKGFSGIATCGVTDRKGAYDKKLYVYYREPDKTAEPEMRSGFKSVDAVKYYTGEKSKKNPTEMATKTYRIPLTVKQWKLAVTDERIRAVLGEPKEGVGLQSVNIADLKDREKLKGDFVDIIMTLAESSVVFEEGSEAAELLNSIKTAVREEDAKKAAEEENAFLGDPVEE